ncbi:MAG TPA: YnfA family protein [Phototrophicaceae bacterium]|nr:YnfA family protein [Phototrophicaceae bacterium]
MENLAEAARTFGLFLTAALCEIGGAYLIWQWQRAGRSVIIALIGLAALFLYSLIQTAQTFGFGRTFAAYGGIFILTALIWGWLVDHQRPDRWDWLGAAICFIGVLVIIAVPRKG